MALGDVDSILDFLNKAPAAQEAHPRGEHRAPLYVALGAAYGSGGIEAKTAIDGFWFGLLQAFLDAEVSPLPRGWESDRAHFCGIKLGRAAIRLPWVFEIGSESGHPQPLDRT